MSTALATETEIVRLISENFRLAGRLEATEMCHSDPVWRRVYLEKLLLLDGFSQKQVFEILYHTERKAA